MTATTAIDRQKLQRHLQWNNVIKLKAPQKQALSNLSSFDHVNIACLFSISACRPLHFDCLADWPLLSRSFSVQLKKMVTNGRTFRDPSDAAACALCNWGWAEGKRNCKSVCIFPYHRLLAFAGPLDGGSSYLYHHWDPILI